MATKIQIRGGQIIGVYDDRLLPLYKALGTPVITRATDVEYNQEGQEWEAKLRQTGETISHGPNRADVIRQEVAYLEDTI